MSKRIQLLCVWTGPAFIVLYAIGFVGFAGFIPPPSPGLGAEQVAQIFDENRFGIRIGQVIGLIATALLFPYFAVISIQIARIEKRLPVLAVIQYGAAVLLLVFFQLCSMLWVAATFREELGASTVRMLNDLSWLIFVMVAPGYFLQQVCVAVASFCDKSPNPVWPRWAGYACLWVGFSGLGGLVAVFFKSGPFAWNGLVGIYIPFACFLVWLIMMTWLMHVGISRQASQDADVDVAGKHAPGQERREPLPAN